MIRVKQSQLFWSPTLLHSTQSHTQAHWNHRCVNTVLLRYSFLSWPASPNLNYPLKLLNFAVTSFLLLGINNHALWFMALWVLQTGGEWMRCISRCWSLLIGSFFERLIWKGVLSQSTFTTITRLFFASQMHKNTKVKHRLDGTWGRIWPGIKTWRHLKVTLDQFSQVWLVVQ